MNFEIIGEISGIQTIATGSSIREVKRLRKQYGKGRWRKLKGIAWVRLASGRIRLAELHWYEAHESGEDYLYPADWFVVVKLPQKVERSLLAAA